MQFMAGTDAADLLQVGAAFLMPVRQVRGGVGFLGGAGEDEVGDFEITLGTTVGGGFGVDRFSHEQGGFTHLLGRTVVATDGGIDFIAINHDGIVAHLGSVFVRGGVASEQQRQNDEGIFLRDEAAAGLHFVDLDFQLADQGLEFTVLVRGQAFGGKLLLGLLQALFPSGEQWIRGLGLFGPGIAGERLVVV